jgi:ribosomal protein L29
MSAIPAKSLREKTSQELEDQLLLEKKRLFDGVVKSASGESIKPHEKREGRRLIARIRTLLSERKLRQSLDKTIADLGPKATKPTAKVAKIVKTVEAKLSAIKTELGKQAGKRSIKPMPPRVRLKDRDQNAADRAAIALAEAKRIRQGLDRDDVGQGK